MQPNLLSLALCGALLSLAPSAPAQTIQVGQVPQSVLDQMGVRAATVQELMVPPAPGQALSVDVVLAGRQRTLDVTFKSLRAADYQLLVDDGTKLTPVPAPAANTFQGTVAGETGSAVAVTVINGQVEAMADFGGETWWVEPASRYIAGLPLTAHLVYRSADVIAKGSCGLAADRIALPPAGTTPPNGALLEAELAMDVTFEFYQRQGASTTNTQNVINATVNAIDAIYVRDVTITFILTTTIIRTTKVYTANGTAVLSQFQSRWNSQHTGVRRDLAHLMADTPSGGILGVAYLGVVCNRSQAYGVTWGRGSASLRAAVMAHECGHNFSAGHCNGSSSCHLMCSAIWSCSSNQNKFGTNSINAITNFKNRSGCLTPPANPPSLTSISPTSVTSYQPQLVTVTGTNLSNLSTVTLGSTAIGSYSSTATSLTFVPPTPFEIATHALTVANSAGTASINLTVSGNHPSVILTPIFSVRGFPLVHEVHTDRNWFSTWLLSTSNAPSALPGIVNLGIGNGFSELFEFITVPADITGTAKFNLTLPNSAPSGLSYYWQAVTYPLPLSFPLEASNVTQSTVL